MNDQNTGHGHAWERPDGKMVRCGGPTMCAACALDAAREAQRLRGWLSYINRNYVDYRIATSDALEGKPVPEENDG